MSNRTISVMTACILLCILALGSWYVWHVRSGLSNTSVTKSPATQALQPNSSSSAPFTDIAGNVLDLEQHIGSVLVVTSWASWSPYSATELALLARVVSEYQSDDVVILAINRGEPRHLAQTYLETIEVADVVQLVVDVDDRYYQAIGGYAMPETIFYSRTGDVVQHERGPLTESELRLYLDQAIDR